LHPSELVHSKIGINSYNSARNVSQAEQNENYVHIKSHTKHSARFTSPSRLSKTIDHSTPLVTFQYEPRLYHLNKLN